ncbi:unnamed protein product [Anisakis simplex]|uniref:ATP-dependent RNA helicase n=1 Tax=Anisakis simplex TaxID=6269 RepID=A0A0M3K143_ANISI|nr:unnamed protein product [Anisakis simplex]
MDVRSFSQLALNRCLTRSFSELFYEKPTDLQQKALVPITEGFLQFCTCFPSRAWLMQYSLGNWNNLNDFDEYLLVLEIISRLLSDTGKDTYIRCFSGFGMGKRVTLAIGIVQNISFNRQDVRPGKVQAIIITRIKSETCELTAFESTQKRATKLKETLQAVGKYLGVKCTVYISDNNRHQIESSVRLSHVLIASPSNVVRLLKHRTIEPNSVKIIVFDEADSLFPNDLDETALNDLHNIFAMTAENAQRTQTLEDYMKRVDLNPARVEIQFNYDNINHYRLFISEIEKGEALMTLLQGHKKGKFVIFTRYAECAEELQAVFESDGSLFLHYDMPKSARYAVVSKFLNGKNYRCLFVRAGLIGAERGDIINFICVENLCAMRSIERFYGITLNRLPNDYIPPVTQNFED